MMLANHFQQQLGQAKNKLLSLLFHSSFIHCLPLPQLAGRKLNITVSRSSGTAMEKGGRTGRTTRDGTDSLQSSVCSWNQKS
ncbi:hypothetical protein DUNSADRAFT_753 [Dunaliella salina]|uniref:Encoded protein n=1 Tax=Dunaliella salina TaxID=3046 RepID=A0ABQ7GXY1_DUNSA|nr:hypothetical protein DUNSADRAFT_753 [Dunaliella salina]|eukprot:KAF5839467.1 hypothetical protein DUNSADRAFT_753 [Dunaliella salina]